MVGLPVSNRKKAGFDGVNFYPTPEWGTEVLLKHVQFVGNVHEPCCGDGAMAEVLKKAGYNVSAADLFDRGYGKIGQNYLDDFADYDNIVTNPPFSLAEEIFKHAYQHARFEICLLLRTAFLESKRRYNNIFSKTPPRLVLVFSERLTMYPAGHVVAGGGTTSYSWFVWTKRYYGPTQVEWIKPGAKR